ncbi:MAG: FAD-binding protein, partial [Candidatus Limnocylindria bacterium]
LRSAAPHGRRWRVALPAVLGLEAHADVRAEVSEALGHPVFEVTGLPPSVPGLRLFSALRRRLLHTGGQIQIGFPVVRVERRGRLVEAVHTEGASRTYRLAAERFVLATGGIAGGGLRATPDGGLEETVFGLPVTAPPRSEWFSPDLGPHPLEAAGIRTDQHLRPVDAAGEPVLDNVHVAGSLLAGMRYLAERCGDGVALASAYRAAAEIATRAGRVSSAPRYAPAEAVA